MFARLLTRPLFLTSTCSTSYQQVAAYLAPSLPKDVRKRLEKHRKVNLTEEDFEDCDDSVERLEIKRERWARFGSQSGVNFKELFPTMKEIAEEKDAEIRWWPTLQQMQANIKLKKEEELKQQEEYERKIAENMAKMPEWISKYEAEQKSLLEKEREREEKQMIEEDEAREKIGFDVPSKHPVLQQYLSQQKEKLKKEKKRLLKLAKAS